MNRCQLCKKREATRLCDYVVEYSNSIVFVRQYKLFKEINKKGTQNTTCDLLMCSECTTSIGLHVDFCPKHIKSYYRDRSD